MNAFVYSYIRFHSIDFIIDQGHLSQEKFSIVTRKELLLTRNRQDLLVEQSRVNTWPIETIFYV
jgi:hypothetical protein